MSDAQQQVAEGSRRGGAFTIVRARRSALPPACHGRVPISRATETVVQADELSRRAAPCQFGQLDAVCVEPRRLARAMPVCPLLHATRPAAFPVGDYPSPFARRRVQAKVPPSVAVGGMLQYAAPAPNGCQSGRKAALIITKLTTDFDGRTAEPISPPTLARRMRHDRPRASVQPSVARLVPSVHAGQVPIAAAPLYVERGDHAVTSTGEA